MTANKNQGRSTRTTAKPADKVDKAGTEEAQLASAPVTGEAGKAGTPEPVKVKTAKPKRMSRKDFGEALLERLLMVVQKVNPEGLGLPHVYLMLASGRQAEALDALDKYLATSVVPPESQEFTD